MRSKRRDDAASAIEREAWHSVVASTWGLAGLARLDLVAQYCSLGLWLSLLVVD